MANAKPRPDAWTEPDDQTPAALGQKSGPAVRAERAERDTLEDPGISGSPRFEVGEILAGKWRIERVLGEGGMGIVVGAKHEQLGTMAAIKFIRGFREAGAGDLARFKREAKIAAKLKSEHVVRVSDVGTLETGEPYLLMEHLEGRDLAAILETDGPLPIGQTIDYALQACEALSEAHAAGIVHRDLKPSNLFRTTRRDGSALIKVLDFGVSKLLPTSTGNTNEGTLTAPSQLIGSPQYMAPEQIDGAPNIDARTDIWAMGVTMYRLMTGKHAFASGTLAGTFAQILTGPAPHLRESRPDASPQVEAVLDRCLKKPADERFQSIRELVAALAACRASCDVGGGPEVAVARDLEATRRADVKALAGERRGRATDEWTAARLSAMAAVAAVSPFVIAIIVWLAIIRPPKAQLTSTPAPAPSPSPLVSASASAPEVVTETPPAAAVASVAPAPATSIKSIRPRTDRPRFKPAPPPAHSATGYDDSQYGGRK